MKIDSKTTDNQLLEFSPKQRSFFVYWAYVHEEQNLMLEGLMEQSESCILYKLKRWTDKQNFLMTSI